MKAKKIKAFLNLTATLQKLFRGQLYRPGIPSKAIQGGSVQIPR
jgi:hypothetical protein